MESKVIGFFFRPLKRDDVKYKVNEKINQNKHIKLGLIRKTDVKKREFGNVKKNRNSINWVTLSKETQIKYVILLITAIWH